MLEIIDRNERFEGRHNISIDNCDVELDLMINGPIEGRTK